MRNRDGLKLLNYTSFSDDVEGQISRRKLRLGSSEADIRAILPAIEAAMAENGITYEHCALGGVAAGQMSVVRIDDQLHRLSIYQPTRCQDSPWRLAMDSMWCGKGGANTSALGGIDLFSEVTRAEISAMMANFVSQTRLPSRPLWEIATE